MTATDEALVLRILDGDQGAFAQLYDQRARLIRAICYDETRDPESAADLTQEVFLRAYAKLGELPDRSMFAAWLVGIARRVCREWRRGRSRERSGALRLLAFGRGTGTDMVANPGPVDLELHELRNAIASLPSKERMAVHAFYLQEQDAEQARLLLGLSRSGLYHVLSSARSRLFQSLRRGEAAR